MEFSFRIGPLIIGVWAIDKVTSDGCVENNMKVLVEWSLPIVTVIRVDHSIKRLNVHKLVVKIIHQLIRGPFQSPLVEICGVVTV